MKKLNNITFCIAPPADAGGVFVCWSIHRRALFVRFFVCVSRQNVIKSNQKKYRKEIKNMREKTDLKAVKETLKLFLYMPIEETDLYPIIIQHPIFDTGYSSIDGEIVDITKPEGLQKAIKKMEEKIDSIDTLIRCSYIMRNSYYLTFLKYIKEYLSLQDFSLLLGKFWTEEENPNGDVNVSVALAARWFRLADKKSLMYDDEYETYTNLPESFIVYRGVTPGRNPNGMSWTREHDKAEWFSNRFGEGYVLKGTVNKKDVLAFFSRRGEEEIVIEAKNVKNKQKI